MDLTSFTIGLALAVLIATGSAWWLGRRQRLCPVDGSCTGSSCLARFLALALLIGMPPTGLLAWPWQVGHALAALLALGVLLHSCSPRATWLQAVQSASVLALLLLPVWRWGWQPQPAGDAAFVVAWLSGAVLLAARPALATLPVRVQVGTWAMVGAALVAVVAAHAQIELTLAAALLMAASAAALLTAAATGAAMLIPAASLVPALGTALLVGVAWASYSPDPREADWMPRLRLVGVVLLPAIPWSWLIAHRLGRPKLGVVLACVVLLGTVGAPLYAYLRPEQKPPPEPPSTYDYRSIYAP